MRADRDPIKDDDAGSEPHVIADADAALGERRLEHDGLRDVGEAVVAACHEVAVPGQEAVAAEADLGFGEQRAVGRNIRMVAEADGSFLATQDRVATDINLLADLDAIVLFALGVEDREVVDDGTGADADLMRVAEGQIAAEDDPLAHFAQQGGIERLPQGIAECPRNAGEPSQEFVFQEGDRPAPADEDIPVLAAEGLLPVTELLLNAPINVLGHTHLTMVVLFAICPADSILFLR